MGWGGQSLNNQKAVTHGDLRLRILGHTDRLVEDGVCACVCVEIFNLCSSMGLCQCRFLDGY